MIVRGGVAETSVGFLDGSDPVGGALEPWFCGVCAAADGAADCDGGVGDFVFAFGVGPEAVGVLC